MDRDLVFDSRKIESERERERERERESEREGEGEGYREDKKRARLSFI